MTPDDVRAAAEQLVDFHERFAPLFGKDEAQDHAYTYLKGLMCCPERKSIEPIALCTGTGQVSGLQKFIAVAPWQYDDVQAEIQSTFADEFVPSAAGTPIGTVGVIDESAFAKKGIKSAGVARQHAAAQQRFWSKRHPRRDHILHPWRTAEQRGKIAHGAAEEERVRRVLAQHRRVISFRKEVRERPRRGRLRDQRRMQMAIDQR